MNKQIKIKSYIEKNIYFLLSTVIMSCDENIPKLYKIYF